MVHEEQLLNKVLFEILSENEKIPYTEEGLKFLESEIIKKLDIFPISYSVDIQDISEISFEDRSQRNMPRITLTLK